MMWPYGSNKDKSVVGEGEEATKSIAGPQR